MLLGQPESENKEYSNDIISNECGSESILRYVICDTFHGDSDGKGDDSVYSSI